MWALGGHLLTTPGVPRITISSSCDKCDTGGPTLSSPMLNFTVVSDTSATCAVGLGHTW